MINGVHNPIKPFRFWCQKVIPLVYDDSLSYYELLCKLVYHINEMGKTVNYHTETLEFLIKTYEDFVGTLNVEQLVDEKLDEMASDGTLENIVNSVLANYQGAQAVILSEHIENHGMQGACYIGNNKIVYYIVGSSDTGELVCFNISTYAEVWRHSLTLEHGNTITYNRNNDSIYVTGCFSQSDQNTVSKHIYKIKMSNPSIIDATITLNRGSYSLVYNESTNRYYSISKWGTEEGVANRVYVYDSEFNEVEYFDLDITPCVTYKKSWQGLGVALEDKIYAVNYESNQTIGVYSLTGKLISAYNVPKIISGYKEVAEIESIVYDFDRDLMYIGFASLAWSSGICTCFMGTNIRGAILPIKIYEGTGNGTTTINCINSVRTTYEPGLIANCTYDLYDAIVAAKQCNGNTIIAPSGNAPEPSLITIRGLRNCTINGNGFQIKALHLEYCDIWMQGVNFISAYTVNSYPTCLTISQSKVNILNCTFNNTDNRYGIFSRAGSDVCEFGCTYSQVLQYGIIAVNGKLNGDNRDKLRLGVRSGYPQQRIKLYEGTLRVGEPHSFADRCESLDGVKFVSFGIQLGNREVTDYLLSTTSDTTRLIKQAWSYEGNMRFCVIVEATFDKVNKTITLNNVQQINGDSSTAITYQTQYIALYI